MFECRERRRRGESERPVLDRLPGDPGKGGTREQVFPGLIEARFSYFLGSLLMQRDPIAARRYLYQAVASWPLHFKAWWKLLWLLIAPPMSSRAWGN